MDIYPYLTFDGRCEEALAFYAQTLGGRILAVKTFEGSPMAGHVSPEWGSKVLHARAEIAGRIILASDASPDRYQAPRGISMNVQADDAAEADRVFGALAEGGTVQMPIQETFWATRFGMLVDRFGIAWMVNCDRPA